MNAAKRTDSDCFDRSGRYRVEEATTLDQSSEKGHPTPRWRAARQGRTFSPPALDVWDLSPASEYVKPYHLFSGHKESADPQD